MCQIIYLGQTLEKVAAKRLHLSKTGKVRVCWDSSNLHVGRICVGDGSYRHSDRFLSIFGQLEVMPVLGLIQIARPVRSRELTTIDDLPALV